MPQLKNYKSDLRAKYKRNFELALIATLALIIAAFKISPKSSRIVKNVTDIQDLIKIEDIQNTVQKTVPPPPKPPQIIAAAIDDLPEEIELDGIEIEQDAPPLPPPSVKPKIVDEDNIFVVVEQIPKPIGGIKAIQEKVEYTEIAKRTGLYGTVYIQAIIDKDGSVFEAQVLKGLGGGLDESALNAVKSTKFYPGKQRGKPVKVKMVIPIKFVLR